MSCLLSSSKKGNGLKRGSSAEAMHRKDLSLTYLFPRSPDTAFLMSLVTAELPGHKRLGTAGHAAVL